MRAPAVSFAERFVATFMAALLAVTLVPASALAEGEGDSADASTEESQEVSALQPDASSGVAPMLASGLVGNPSSFVSADVALDSEPVIGSFTVDGLTFAVTEGSDVELVGVSSDWQQITSSQEGDGSPVAPMLASGPDGLEADGSALAIPESIAYEGVDYAVTSIGAYAFYLSGVTAVELPVSIAQVDDRAFRSSDVASVTVADGNAAYSSFDGALYDAAQLSLLLIPEGKQGTVLLPSTAESAAPSVFSHCPLVTQVSVEEGSAAFASENGLLYDASLTTLLRVPAGATDITIRDGCTTIAAGAMEACASLVTITAPASVTSISPDVFTSVPTVSLPAVSAVADDPGASTGATEESSEQAISIPASGSTTTQLTAMVALSSTDDDLPKAGPSAITVRLSGESDLTIWEARNFPCAMIGPAPLAETERANIYAASWQTTLDANGGVYNYYKDNVLQASAERRTVTCYSPNAALWGDGTFHYYSSIGATVTKAYASRTGYRPAGVTGTITLSGSSSSQNITYGVSETVQWTANTYTVAFDLNGGTGTTLSNIAATYDKDLVLPAPELRHGYEFLGWNTERDGSGTTYEPGTTKNLATGGTVTLYAQWEREEYDLVFDVDSEPGDEDYPGIDKPDETVNVDDGPTVIEDPKRPGYVFQGWVIPNAEGTEAIDQDLVYKDEADGKWYVDASKLPDYANDEGRVELTARWTSVISVDVPSAVTFYADVVTEGQESREGAVSSAFGQNKVASQSEVDLRIVGLESTAVETQGSTLGADSILKKSASATPSSSTQKLFSLYPTDKALTADDLQDPDAVSQAKPSDAVDFALDDLLLEKSFASDKFTIPAGDTLNLGYRLNLAETGTELDYDTLSALDEGQSASIANISYCFATEGHHPTATGSTSDDFYIEYQGRIYGPDDIKASAECIASLGEASPCYALYSSFLASGMDPSDPADAHGYVKWGDGTTYDVRIIGLNHDEKADGSGKAGITFQFVNLLDADMRMNPGGTIAGGWKEMQLRQELQEGGSLFDEAPLALSSRMATVKKLSATSNALGASVQETADQFFILSISEYSTSLPSDAPWREGTPYEFYASMSPGIVISQPDARFVKGKQGSPSTPQFYWLRTISRRADNNSFTCVLKDGAIYTNMNDSSSDVSDGDVLNVCPAFCL